MLMFNYNSCSSTKFGSVTFNKGCVSIALFMAKMAPSFRAQLLLEIPLLTSQKSIDTMRFDASFVPSRTIPNPPLITSPQPTPPPLWMETHVAPLKLSPITFCIAISAVKREPSWIFEVSLYGESVPETSW